MATRQRPSNDQLPTATVMGAENRKAVLQERGKERRRWHTLTPFMLWLALTFALIDTYLLWHSHRLRMRTRVVSELIARELKGGQR
ncbi:MAG: hypothetical protein ONB30_12360 [candidate division KSB1 bacterium]|nr:hypothetical protein [candidate division KSB1 bacterium]